MKHTAVFVFAAMFVVPVINGQSSAPQAKDTPQVTVLPGFGPAGNLVSAQPHFPFSATVVQRWEQALSDGTHISRDIQETVMRDDMGRIYRARTIEVPRGRTQNVPRLMITIADPVQHVQYICTPIRICRKTRYDPRERPWLRGPDPRKLPDTTVEDLGSLEIAGIEAQGTRVTRVIPEGAAGNDRPFTSTEEVWHSKQLGVDLKVTKSDPRWGTRTTTMSEISLAEPDSRCFQIPEGYRVEEGKGVRGSSGMAMSPIPMEGDDPNMARMVTTKE